MAHKQTDFSGVFAKVAVALVIGFLLLKAVQSQGFLKFPAVQTVTEQSGGNQPSAQPAPAPAPVPTPAPTLEGSFIRLQQNCQPEREMVAKQISKVLDAARSTAPEMPEYISQEVNLALGDFDTGLICFQSEQNTDRLIPNAIMSSQDTPPYKIFFYIQSLDPDDKTFRYNVAFSTTHERLHIELKYPEGLDGFLDEEVEIRKRVCRGGVIPVVNRGDQSKVPAWMVSQCNWLTSNPEAAEKSIRAEYRRIWQHWEEDSKK